MIYHLPKIENSRSGFEALAGLAGAASRLFVDRLEVDFSSCDFFAANMAAPLGSILSRIEEDFNSIEIVGIPPVVATILRKNGFLENYGYPELEDNGRTTLPFRRIQLSDDTRFEGYVKRHLKGKGIPSMSEGFGAAFKRKLFEIFQNSVIHSRSFTGVCVCGQFFPNLQRLDFTISDAGVGIRQNVRKHLGNPKLSSVEAIRWALEEGNSTKTGGQPGGLGLKFLKDFIHQNQGTIQIVSRLGFYQFSAGNETFETMQADFPGTTVNIEINTGDTASYRLPNELTPDDIF